MAFLSRTSTIANGVQTAFVVGFPYQAVADVDIYVYPQGGSAAPGSPLVVGIDFNWTSPGTYTFVHAPASGMVVEARRSTKINALNKTPLAGGTFKAADGVSNDTQLLFLEQEALDAQGEIEALVASLAGQVGPLAASVSAIAIAAAAGLHVDTTFMVRPEAYGATGAPGSDAAAALTAAAGAAALLGGKVQLSSGATYDCGHEVIVPVGVDIDGPASASLRLPNQVATTTTSAITAGPGAKTFTVASAAGLAVGMSVMLATGATVSPSDPFSHAGRQITAIVGNSITIGAGPNVNAHASGAIFATTSHLLRLQGKNTLRGFTVDGNAANNTYGHWITSALIVQEGDDCRKLGLNFKNTPSDAFLAGGPSAGEIKGSWTLWCSFENIGGNGCHYGNARDMFVFGNRAKLGNARFALPVEQAGGAGASLGHQDGFVTLSDNCNGLLVSANRAEDWAAGVGGLGTSGSNLNDNVSVTGNEFINCFAPISVSIDCRRILFSNNICRAALPFASGSNRWNSQIVSIDGASTTLGIRSVVVMGNVIRNGAIRMDRPRGFIVKGNTIDNSEMMTATYAAAAMAMLQGSAPLQLYNYDIGVVTGNVCIGGFCNLYLQNSFALAANLCRDTLIEENVLVNAYRIAVFGALGSTGTLDDTILRNNSIRQDTAGTTDEGVALTFGAVWEGIATLQGLQIEHNRISYNHGSGSAFSVVHAGTYAKRRYNKVNGLVELLGNYANDAAAAAAGLSVGDTYRNGGVVQQRVA